MLEIKKDVKATDNKNNIIETEHAKYNEISKTLNTFGPTKITTTDNYIIESEDLSFDNLKRVINSNSQATIIDQDENKIYLENFEYLIEKNIFKSIGRVKIIDKNKNSYEFSQVYIDTKKKEILGTDSKLFINQQSLKINEKNKPRVFANTTKITENEKIFKKNIFTICDYRKDDKCPPWSIQSSEMLHDNKKKTVFYKNAIIKVYDIPIFYIPRISHPDPSVDRRSGFLPPIIQSSKNLGLSVTTPYFFNVSNDKNFTFTNRLFANNHPLFLGEYHQAFKNSHFLADFGYTDGYKKTNSKKRAGKKSHFFSEFNKNFIFSNQGEGSLSFKTQEVSNDKYLKLYKLNSQLTDYNKTTLENSIDFTYQKEDLFFGLNSSIFESIEEGNEEKYEYVYPDLTIGKNLISNNRFGNLDLLTNYKVNKYETNKFTNFLVNDLNWNLNYLSKNSVFKNEILGNFKNINYEANNIDLYKEETTSEFYGALGFLSKLELRKNTSNLVHKLTPKILIRHAPGSMRKEPDEDGSRVDPTSAFSMNRLDHKNNFETGLSSTIGVDYIAENENKSFDFSIAQIINEKENKKMATISGMDEKLSDVVGSSSIKFNEKFKIGYNFNLDQNLKEFNYNDFNTKINFDPMNISFSYLTEDKHIASIDGKKEYFTTKIDYTRGNNGLFSFETKRNLISGSEEFYNLSYEYLNDCLRAGLVYRREFYNDSEVEPEDSLMFRITLTPFGGIETPALINE